MSILSVLRGKTHQNNKGNSALADIIEEIYCGGIIIRFQINRLGLLLR
jgi:hypothetical protein